MRYVLRPIVCVCVCVCVRESYILEQASYILERSVTVAPPESASLDITNAIALCLRSIILSVMNTGNGRRRCAPE